MKELFFSYASILLLVWLVAVNLFSVFLVIYDKHISKKPRGSVRRIPEKAFIKFSALGGGIGTFLAMLLVHHKTKSHNLLLLKIALWTALWTVLILAVLKFV